MPTPPVIEEPEVPVPHGFVVPYAAPDVLGSGTAGIGLSPLVSVSVAPRGIVLPTTFDVDPGAWVDDVMPLDAVEQLWLDVSPPPSKVEEVDDVVVVPRVVPVALHDELVVGPKPPGSISVAPSGMPAPIELLPPFGPNMPNGEVAPIPEGLKGVCAVLDAQAQSSASAAIENLRMGIFCLAPRFNYLGMLYPAASPDATKLSRRL